MKRVCYLFVVAALLLATPAFSVDARGQNGGNTVTYTGSTQAGSQTNVINELKQNDVTQIQAGGRNNVMETGIVRNSGGTQTNVINQVEQRNSKFIQAGESGSTMRNGVVENSN